MLVTIDGKILRGSLAPGQDQTLRLLAAYLPAEGIVPMQEVVACGENELSAAPRVLQRLDLRGEVMGDAMFTQRELSTQIVEAGGGQCQRRDLRPTASQIRRQVADEALSAINQLPLGL